MKIISIFVVLRTTWETHGGSLAQFIAHSTPIIGCGREGYVLAQIHFHLFLDTQTDCISQYTLCLVELMWLNPGQRNTAEGMRATSRFRLPRPPQSTYAVVSPSGKLNEMTYKVTLGSICWPQKLYKMEQTRVPERPCGRPPTNKLHLCYASITWGISTTAPSTLCLLCNYFNFLLK